MSDFRQTFCGDRAFNIEKISVLSGMPQARIEESVGRLHREEKRADINNRHVSRSFSAAWESGKKGTCNRRKEPAVATAALALTASQNTGPGCSLAFGSELL